VTVDCDVHARAPSMDELAPHLTDYWRDYVHEAGFFESGGLPVYYPPNAPTSRAATVDEVRAHLDATGTEIAILNCMYGVESFRRADFGSAIATALNDWLAAAYLDRDPRLRASVVVKPDDPEGAAAEIERRADDPRFVQVLLPARAGDRPYGNRFYRPLLETAARRGLPVALHFGGTTGNPPTPVGWPSWYLEEVVGFSHIYQAQLTSLVAEGALEALPELRIVLAESGWTWLPPLLWRLDKEWKGLQREIPWVKRAPSRAIREQVRVTLQPIDAPPEPRQLLETIEQLGTDELLLYATDFPHPHVHGAELLPAALLERARETNPRATYTF
jgi:predicted TIM-barrel fold metal-dependent hydrolase